MFAPTISYSRRKTLSISINSQGNVIVKAPHLTPKWYIHKFIESKSTWITTQLSTIQERTSLIQSSLPSELDIQHKKKHAKQTVITRVNQLANISQLAPTSVRISSARTRWGSCSSRNSISINWRLTLLPQECLDYVIFHELAHISHKNHSKQFWMLVNELYPTYKDAKKLLVQYQSILHQI
jgi:predicted metal-dependent hydrolase